MIVSTPFCPRCQRRASAQRFYGPCQPCREELRRNAMFHGALRNLFAWWRIA